MLSVSNIAGEFVDGHVIIGASSNAQFTLATFDPLRDNQRDDSFDNFIIEQQANNVVNLNETNPFGTI